MRSIEKHLSFFVYLLARTGYRICVGWETCFCYAGNDPIIKMWMMFLRIKLAELVLDKVHSPHVGVTLYRCVRKAMKVNKLRQLVLFYGGLGAFSFYSYESGVHERREGC